MLIVAAVAGLGLVAAAAPAMAGDSPTPTPTITQVGTPPPCQFRCHHRHLLLPQRFDVLINSLGTNRVDARGPVQILGGSDVETGQVLSRFVDTLGNHVNVQHDPLPRPLVDLQTCSVIFDQNDGRWRFNGGDGLFRRAFGFGVFDLRALFSFAPDRWGNCGLRRLSSDQITSLVVSGNPVIKCRQRGLTLEAFSVSVQGAGRATLRLHRPGIFTPTASPTVTETVASG
jgi:hypothetical protein